MSKRTWRWVTRDDGTDDVWVWFGPGSVKKPLERTVFGAVERDSYGAKCFSMCHRQFKAATGITVPSSHPIKVDFGGVRVVE